MTRSSTLSPRVDVHQQEVLPLSVDTAASTSLLAHYSDPMTTSPKTKSMFSSKSGADTAAKSALFPFEAPPRKGSYAASADILAARPRANGVKKKQSSIGVTANDRFRRGDIINSTNGFDHQTLQDSQRLGLSRSTSSEAANRTMTQANGQSGHTRAIAALHDPATFIDQVVALSNSTTRLPLLLLRRPSGAEVDYAATLASAASRLTFALKARKGKGVAGSQPSPQVSLAGDDLLGHVERLATCATGNGSGSGDDPECLRESIKFMLVLCEAQGAVARPLKTTINKAAPELAFSAHEEAASQNNSEASSIPHFLRVPENKHSSLPSPSSGLGTMASPDMPRRSLVQSGLAATGMSPPNLSRLDVPDSSTTTTTTSNWSLDSSSSPVSQTLHTDPSIALAQARRIISRLLEDRVMMQQEVDDLNAAVFLEASDLLHAERLRNAELEAEVERLKLEQGAQKTGSSGVLDVLNKDGPASSSASATSPTHTVFSSSSKVPSSSGSLLEIQQPVAALDLPGFETAGTSPAEVVARAPSPAAASSQAASPPNARAGSLSSTDGLLLVKSSTEGEISSRPADDSDGRSGPLASQSEDAALKADRSSSKAQDDDDDDYDNDDDDDDDEDVFADTFDHLNAFPPAPPREVPFDFQTTPAGGTPEADQEIQRCSRRGSLRQHNRRWSNAESSICSSGRRASLPPRPPEPNSPLPELPAGAIPSPTSPQFEYQLRSSTSALPAIDTIVEQPVPGAVHNEQLQDSDAVPGSGASTDPHADWLSSVLKHGKPLIPQRMQSSTWPSPPTTDDERPSFQTQSSRGSDTLRAPSPLPPYHPALPGRDASLTNDLSPPKNGVDSRRRAPSHASTASTKRSSTLTTSSVPTSVSSGAMLHSKSSHNGNNGLRLRPHQSPTHPSSSSSSSSREPRDLAALGVGNPPVASKNKPSKASRSRILANIDRSSSWSNEGSSSARSDLAFAVPEPVPVGHLQSHLVVRRQSAPRRMSSFTSGAAPILPTRSSSASVPPYSEMMEEGEEAAALRKETAGSNGGYGRVGAMTDNERATSSARAEEETSSENQWGTRRWRYAGA